MHVERRKKERAAYSEERKKTFSKFSMDETARANRNSRRFNNRGPDEDRSDINAGSTRGGLETLKLEGQALCVNNALPPPVHCQS